MQEFLIQYFSALFSLIKEIWLFFLLGFLTSALIQEFVSTEKLLLYFGGNDWKSLFRATVSSLFVSVCSCGAIPIAAMLRKRGASVASSLTFLLAAPWGGFLHVFLISSFVGFKNTFILVFFSLVVAFISGLVISKLENKKIIEQAIPKKHSKDEKHICIECIKIEEERKRHKKERLTKRLFQHIPKTSFEIFLDVGKYILLGIFIAAFLKAFIPSEIITNYLGNGNKFLPILIAVPISAVIELASEGFGVLAGQLYKLGASLGVVFIVTLVGVTTDFTEMSMIWGKFGKKSALAYLSISTTFAILFAFLINILF